MATNVYLKGFVYCWTDHKYQKLYIGSRKGHINDGYICSSKLMLQEYNIRPQDFSRQIVAEGHYHDMRKLEEVLLKGFNVKEDSCFYNQHNSDGNFFLTQHTEESKRKISETIKALKIKRPDLVLRNKQGHSAETRKRISENHADVSGRNNPRIRELKVDGKSYYGFKELKEKTGLTRFLYEKYYECK